MAFRDELVRCGACGSQFVYTVREQRRRASLGLPLDPPAFCDVCRAADARLAEADGADRGEQPTAVTERVGEPRSGSDARGRSTPPAGRTSRPAQPDRRGRRDARGPRGRAGRGEAPRGRRSESARRPRQTELRIRHLGTVKWYDPDRGFGFIAQEDGEEVFVHSSGVLAEGAPDLQQGQSVEFEVESTPRGLQAVDVVPVG